MKKFKRMVYFGIAFFIIILAGAQSSQAQQYWMNQHEGNSVGLKIVKPIFDSRIDDLGFMTTSWFFSGQFIISNNLEFVYQLPFSNITSKDESDQSESVFGNPYIGLKLTNINFNNSRFITHFGIRLPAASDEKRGAISTGYIANFEEMEAFIPELMTLSFAATFQSLHSDRSVSNLSFGGDYMLSTGDNDSEFYFNYNLDFISTSANNIIFGAGFTGRLILTSSGASFGERSIHQFALLAGYKGSNLKPIFTFKIPIDQDLGEVISYVLGFNFIYKLN